MTQRAGSARAGHSNTEPLIAVNDVVKMFMRLYAGGVTRTRAERHWPAAAGIAAAASARLRPSRTRSGVERIERFFEDGVPGGGSSVSLLQRITARHIEETMMYARLAQRPDWRPPLALAGVEHLEAARSGGQGVVIWAVHQIASLLLLRIALHDAGYALHHLSHWTHGPSTTRVGQAVLGTSTRRIEERFAKRVLITPDGPLAALRELGRVVRAGGIATFRGIGMADAPLTLPVHGGHMKLAVGAPRTARLAQAPLLSARASRDVDGRWTVHLAPLCDARSTESAKRTAERFAALVAEAIAESPDLWPVHDQSFITAPSGSQG